MRDGHFVSIFLSDASSWSEVINAAIARPTGRETLLAPAVERVAIGPLASDKAHGALFSTYALFDNYRHDDDARTMAARIAAGRAEHGLGGAQMAADLSAEAQRAAVAVQAGQRTTTQALNEMLQHTTDKLGRSVRGWVAETTALNRVQLPAELLARPALTLGIGVAHHKTEGAAWGRFVVFIVMLDETVTGPQTARVEGVGGG